MAKKFVSSSINWTLISESTDDAGRSAFMAFKGKFDKQLRKLGSQPAELPKIDWNYYKSKIALPGMVDTYKASFESLKIPYPSDQGFLAQINEQEVKFKNHRKLQFEKASKEIAQLQEKLKKLEAVMPYREMNMEELYFTKPDYTIDVNNPELWPKIIK